MSTQDLSMAEARAQVCRELTQFAADRRDGLTGDEAAAARGLGAATADLYEATLRELLQLAANTIYPAPDALERIRDRTEEAAPVAPGAARQAHTNTSEESPRHE